MWLKQEQNTTLHYTILHHITLYCILTKNSANSLGNPSQRVPIGVFNFVSKIRPYFVLLSFAFNPCQGNFPFKKYMSIYATDSKSSRLLCAMPSWFAILAYLICRYIHCVLCYIILYYVIFYSVIRDKNIYIYCELIWTT